MAAHILQYIVVDVLKGDVKVVAHIGMSCHYVQNLIREFGRVGIVQPNPFDSVNFRHPVDKFRKGKPLVYVKTVGRQVLGNDVEFFYSFSHQPSYLFKDFFNGTRLVSASNQWNCTECTKTIAALGNFEICVMRGGGYDSIVRHCRRIALDYVGYNVYPIKLAIDSVYFRNLGQ